MAKKKTETKSAEAAPVAPKPEVPIVAYKGFDKDLRCRGFQFEVGKTYEHDGPVESCRSGFHACLNPVAVFEFYPPAKSRYSEVRLSGPVCNKETPDTKIAAARISIEVELSISDLVKRAFDYVWGNCTLDHGNTTTGDRSASQATGYQGASQATGYQGASQVRGKNSVAWAHGFECRALAVATSAIGLTECDERGNILAIFASKVGENGIKPNKFYMLKDGKPVEVA